MFFSGGVDLKIHSSGEEGVETFPVQQSSSSSRILKVSVCNDNSYIVVLRDNEKPQIFSSKDHRSMRLIHTINISNVTALTFKHNTKKHIALGTRSGDVVIYNTKGRNVASIFAKVADTIQALEFSCDDEQLCGFDGPTFFVFPDIDNDSNAKTYKQKSLCSCLKCHPFIANRVALGLTTGHVVIWNLETSSQLLQVKVLTTPVTGLCMSSCGNFLIVAGKQLKICSLDLDAKTCNFRHTLVQDRATSADVSPDDKLLVVGLDDGTIKLFDIKQQFQELCSCKAHEKAISLIVFENKAQEANSNFTSLMKLASDIEVKEKRSNVDSSVTVTKTLRSVRSTRRRDESLEKVKKAMWKMVKTEMDSLENQLQEHCAKFQKFLDNEFETIDEVIKKKWDIFNIGDMNQIVKAICPEEGRCE